MLSFEQPQLEVYSGSHEEFPVKTGDSAGCSDNPIKESEVCVAKSGTHPAITINMVCRLRISADTEPYRALKAMV